MKYLSLCSGIEAASVAWHHMGWGPVAFSEIESFPSAVLANHYPATPNWGDMTKYQEWPDANVDVLVGGTPCQSFSVAGLRKGLADPRGNLMLTFGAIASKYRPRWLVWENVPGVLSSNGGRDFGTFLGMLGELGYGFAYRVLDAQYFGVAQRRRRVFVVGCLGDWRRAAAVLFERHSLSGHPAPSRKTRKATPTIPSRSTAGKGISSGNDPDVMNTLCATDAAKCGSNQWVKEGKAVLQPVAIAWDDELNASVEQAGTLLRGGADGRRDGVMQPISFHPTQDPISSVNACHAIGTGSKHGCATAAVAQPVAEYYSHDYCHDRVYSTDGISPALNCSQDHTIRTAMQVRRLTPVECEHLQGFPDNYTAIPWRGKSADHCPDGPRYKALGNSMAVPVMRWIGERINQVETL